MKSLSLCSLSEQIEKSKLVNQFQRPGSLTPYAEVEAMETLVRFAVSVSPNEIDASTNNEIEGVSTTHVPVVLSAN